MTREQWQLVRGILEQALESPLDQRSRILDQACPGNAELRAEVESLLAAGEEASREFLEGTAIDHIAEVNAADLKDDQMQGLRIGSYRVLEEIGHGGMGTVYRAVRADDQYSKQVAIKVMRGGWGDRLALERFRAERQILANLEHANIARLLDGGTSEDGRPYVVMEYADGRPIDEYCNAHKLSVRARLELFRTVCSAVTFAHQHLVIHRDIKPGNILVTKEGEAKLLDFGIAKISQDERSGDATVTMVRMLTPEYASPEQIGGAPVTTATDVYSLGVVLYGLLTGHRPYAAGSRTPHEMAQAVLLEEPERPSVVVNGAEKRRLRGDLDNIALKALRKEPERRYASVEQFSDDIRRHLEGLPVAARPDTLMYRGSKFVRRHSVAVIAAGLAVLALLAGMAATLRETYIAREERRRAEQRFNDVRKLANSLLFDVHDAIENLPGATPARKILVDRALQYLDKLAAEAKGDLSLQRELATAYEKVGTVQGGFRLSNLGDKPGSIQSYRKALAIREAISRGEPGNVDAQRDLLRAHGLLSDALMGSGDTQGSVDELRQLLPIAEKLSAADPGNIANQRNLALAYLDYGFKRSSLGDSAGGLEDCRKAVGMLESVAAREPANKRNGRVLALAYDRVRELLSTYQKQHAEALAMYEKALGAERSLLAGDPRNTDIRRMSGWDMLRSGDEIFAQGEVTKALARYRESLTEEQALSAADPKNVQFHLDIAAGLARLGAVDLKLGRADAARNEFQHSLAEVDLTPLDVDSLELKAEDQFRMGKADEMAGRRREAQAWFERSIPNLEAATSKGILRGESAALLAQARKELEQLEAANRQ
jgi:eukaryotic-like serine/threonine-protein kinase